MKMEHAGITVSDEPKAGSSEGIADFRVLQPVVGVYRQGQCVRVGRKTGKQLLPQRFSHRTMGRFLSRQISRQQLVDAPSTPDPHAVARWPKAVR